MCGSVAAQEGKAKPTESGGTVASSRNSHSGGLGLLLARLRPTWEGFQWFSCPLQVIPGLLPLRIGHAVCPLHLACAFISVFIYHYPLGFVVAYNPAVPQRQ